MPITMNVCYRHLCSSYCLKTTLALFEGPDISPLLLSSLRCSSVRSSLSDLTAQIVAPDRQSDGGVLPIGVYWSGFKGFGVAAPGVNSNHWSFCKDLLSNPNDINVVPAIAKATKAIAFFMMNFFIFLNLEC